jgi:hypothetical protein
LSYFFYSSAIGPHGHDKEEFNSLSLCCFVLVLQVNQVHNDEEPNSSLSCFFFGFDAINPKDMTMRSLSPCHHVFFCSSVEGL